MRKVDWLLLLTISVFMTALVVSQSACAQSTSPPPAPGNAAGGVTPVGTVKDIMRGIVDPNSAVIWDAVGTEATKDGSVEKAPKTDEEWAVVENSAMVLAEVANLLRMPGRHIARPEQANSKSAPDAPELTPAQIEEKVNQDHAAWEKKADEFQQTAVKALAAARAHDKDGVLNVGSEIDSACESCHVVYWYPSDNAPKTPAGPAPKS